MVSDTPRSTETPSYEIPEHVLFRQVEGQMVLLDLDSERYFGLNEVGADIVSRLTSQSETSALKALAAEYDVEAGVLERDVAALVRELLAAGLLQRTEG